MNANNNDDGVCVRTQSTGFEDCEWFDWGRCDNSRLQLAALISTEYLSMGYFDENS